MLFVSQLQNTISGVMENTKVYDLRVCPQTKFKIFQALETGRCRTVGNVTRKGVLHWPVNGRGQRMIGSCHQTFV